MMIMKIGPTNPQLARRQLAAVHANGLLVQLEWGIIASTIIIIITHHRSSSLIILRSFMSRLLISPMVQSTVLIPASFLVPPVVTL
jgi:hypothetical protein